MEEQRMTESILEVGGAAGPLAVLVHNVEDDALVWLHPEEFGGGPLPDCPMTAIDGDFDGACFKAQLEFRQWMERAYEALTTPQSMA